MLRGETTDAEREEEEESRGKREVWERLWKGRMVVMTMILVRGIRRIFEKLFVRKDSCVPC